MRFMLVSPLEPARRNIPSAGEHPEVITKHIEKECAEGRILGPFHVDDIEPRVQISRFGVISKGHTPGKWRLILDLSFPEGLSVNDGIPSDLCSIVLINKRSPGVSAIRPRHTNGKN